MPKGISDKPIFKEYNQNQIELLPKTADELIPQSHLFRLVDDTLDKRKKKYTEYRKILGERRSFSKTDTDAGYGSEQNYEYLEEKDITAYVKYNTYMKDMRLKRYLGR